jgi:hypothetical protein
MLELRQAEKKGSGLKFKVKTEKNGVICRCQRTQSFCGASISHYNHKE